MTQFLAANWLWIALIVAMFAMHRGGGCGSHGHGHGREQHRSAERGAGHADHTDHAGHADHARHPASGRSET